MPITDEYEICDFNDSKSMHFNNFPEYLTEDDITELFHSHGFKLESVRLFSDKNKKSRGKGFLNFSSAVECQRCYR